MKLLFVYNSDGNFTALVGDTIHKLASPDTYQCNLCRLTYPFVSINAEWKKFVMSLSHEVLFLHRDEFARRYPNYRHMPLPAVFEESSRGLGVLISPKEINKAQNIQELIKIVKSRVAK